MPKTTGNRASRKTQAPLTLLGPQLFLQPGAGAEAQLPLGKSASGHR